MGRRDGLDETDRRRRRGRESDGSSSERSDVSGRRERRRRRSRSLERSGSRDRGKSGKKKHKKSKRRHRGGSDADSEEEEERARRKQRKKAEKVLASFGYSNETNPFGDSSLSQPFVWSKKYEGDKKAKPPSEKELKKQQLQRVEEIRKARKRREEREAEKEEMERLKSEELRLRDAEQYDDWQQKEEDFHLQQTKVRSKLRIQARREKPVDLLAKNLLLVSARDAKDDEDKEDFFNREIANVRVEHRRPFAIVEVLSMDELEELRGDIATYLELEGDHGVNTEFWRLMTLVCDDRIRRLRRSQSESDVGRGAIHESVNDTITDMLRGKGKDELRKLQTEVEDTIASAEHTAGVDVGFWEEVAQQIQVYQARARLKELHEAMLDKLADLMNEHDQRAFEDESKQAASRGELDGRDDSREARELEQSFADKEGSSEDRLGAADEVALAVEATPEWSEKYQPRKPRYFNRVKTGYDWNKYNQTHYDHDNPPPKVVQGYKFNLFYPDLIDKTKAPRFVLEKTNSPDFCIIRFTAGPPYQDIAFKIVNREWEYSHKRGFKSVFERGILHLYFNFKRHRYRR